MDASNAPPLAPWWKRAFAAMIDWFIWMIPTVSLAVVLFTLFVREFNSSRAPGEPANFETIGDIYYYLEIFVFVIVNVGLLIYQVALNGNRRGQTLGKMAMRIRVRNAATLGPLGYGRATLRYFVNYALWLACVVPGIVNFMFPLWDERRQTLHDKVAGSIVVDLDVAR